MASEDSRNEDRALQRRFARTPSLSPNTPIDLVGIRNSINRAAAGLAPDISEKNNPLDEKEDFNAKLLKALRRQSEFIMSAFAGAVAPVLLRPKEERSYFLIQNTSASGVLYISFGNAGTPTSSIQIVAGGYYEPYQVPQNDVFISSSIAGVTGVLVYAN